MFIRRMPYDKIKVPIYTAADIQKGALVMPGVTTTDSSAKDLSCAILADATAANAIGYLTSLFDYSVEGTTDVYTATKLVLAEVQPVFNFPIIGMEYDLTDTMALAGDESSKTITITNLEDNIDGSWLYFVGGTAIGQLRFVVTSAAGSCVINTACNPEADTGDTCIKILRTFHTLLKLTTTRNKLGTDAAAGGWTGLVLGNYICRGNSAWERLDQSKHELNGLNADGVNVNFHAELLIRSTAGNPID